VDLAEEVRLEDCAEDLARDLLEAPVGDHAGAVDPHVEGAEALDRRTRERLDGGLVAHVGRHRDRGGAHALDLLGQRRQRTRRARCEDEPRALPREPRRPPHGRCRSTLP
jgi:hypothetical protein